MISSAEKLSILAGLIGTALLRFETLSESAGSIGVKVLVLCLAFIVIAFAWAALSFPQNRLKGLVFWLLILLIVATAVEVFIRMLSFIIEAGFNGTGPLPVLASILCFGALIQIWLISGIPRKLLKRE
jgi:hypothetical protein